MDDDKRNAPPAPPPPPLRSPLAQPARTSRDKPLRIPWEEGGARSVGHLHLTRQALGHKPQALKPEPGILYAPNPELYTLNPKP